MQSATLSTSLQCKIRSLIYTKSACTWAEYASGRAEPTGAQGEPADSSLHLVFLGAKPLHSKVPVYALPA